MCVRAEKKFIVFASCLMFALYLYFFCLWICVLCGMHNPPSHGIGLLEYIFVLLPFVSIGINVLFLCVYDTECLVASMNVCWRRYVFVMAPGAHNNNNVCQFVFVADLSTNYGKMLPLPFFATATTTNEYLLVLRISFIRRYECFELPPHITNTTKFLT